MSRRFLFAMIFSGLMLVTAGLYAADVKEKDASRGKVIYEVYCLVCHGAEGKGDGPSAPAMIPPPPDFTSPAIKEQMTKDRTFTSITDGVEGTQMEGWKERLSSEDIQEVNEYIQTVLMGKK